MWNVQTIDRSIPGMTPLEAWDTSVDWLAEHIVASVGEIHVRYIAEVGSCDLCSLQQ